jgi:aspartyl protease family protein
MLRKLLIVGVCAGSSASIPILYESNPDAFERLLRPAARQQAATEAPQPAARIAPPDVIETMPGRKVRIAADARGHFSGEFRINGRRVRGMVDTGATLVAINLSTARRIGLNLMPVDFKHKVSTANGEARAAVATLESLQVGRIRVEDVEAVVLDDRALSETLIGVSFLSRLSKYQVENGALLMVQ